MKRRGQLMTQVLIYVVGLVVIGLVLWFGVQAMQNLNNDRCEVERIQFGTQLSQALDRNNDWGTNNIVTLRAPCETQQICFVDREIIDDATNRGDYFADDISGRVKRQINDTVQTNVFEGQPTAKGDRKNVFFVEANDLVRGVDKYSTQAAPVAVREGSNPIADCIPTRDGQLRVRMQGNGAVAQIIDPAEDS